MYKKDSKDCYFVTMDTSWGMEAQYFPVRNSLPQGPGGQEQACASWGGESYVGESGERGKCAASSP